MIIDTSAILAILFEEAEADHFMNIIAAASSRRISETRRNYQGYMKTVGPRIKWE